MNLYVTGTAQLLFHYEVTLEDIGAAEFNKLRSREQAELINKALQKQRSRVDFVEDGEHLGIAQCYEMVDE